MANQAWILLVLLVGTPPDPASDPAEMVAQAARDALGTEARVVVRRFEDQPSEDEALRLARAEHADAVAQIVRADADPPKILVHVHPAHAPRWIDRELRFAQGDAPADEWRTVGFAVASMVPDRVSAQEPAELAVPMGAQAPEHRLGFSAAREVDAPAGVAPSAPQRVALDVAAIGAGPFYSDEGNVGATVAGNYFFLSHFGVRAATALRTSEAEIEGGPEARSLFLEGALGVAWRSDTHARPGEFAYGARLDVLVTTQRVWKDSNLAPERSLTRVAPGMDLVGEASWAFSEHAALLVGAGGQAAFVTSPVRLGGERVATLAPIAPLFQTGIRARF